MLFRHRRPSVHPTPRRAALQRRYNRSLARVVKQVDTKHLKCLDRKVVPVRVRSRAPAYEDPRAGDRMLISGSCHCGNIGLRLEWMPEPTRQAEISYAVFCLKKKNKN